MERPAVSTDNPGGTWDRSAPCPGSTGGCRDVHTTKVVTRTTQATRLLRPWMCLWLQDVTFGEVLHFLPQLPVNP